MTTTAREATAAPDGNDSDPSAPTEPDELPEPVLDVFEVPAGSGPHDVWVGPDGTVWYTAQQSGRLGALDPDTGEVREIDLGANARPHGVITDSGGTPWVTDGGLNAIVRVDLATDEVSVYPLPPSHPDANLNTATFGTDGTLWFTGQAGVYGRLAPGAVEVEVFDAPRGRGPYGITTTPDGDVYYASLAGDHVARIDVSTGDATVLEPPTASQGTRRVWSDSEGRIWSSQWTAGQVARYDPSDGSWQEWALPGDAPQAYAVYVDDRDHVWLSDFTANAMVRFDPTTEQFSTVPLPSEPSDVRQIHGRPGEVWVPESAADQIVRIRTR